MSKKEYVMSEVPEGMMVNDYLVKIKEGKVTNCNCAGYKFGRKCKHSDMVKEHLNKINPVIAEKRFSHDFCKRMVEFFQYNCFGPNNIKYEVAGSYRRDCPDSKDLDIIILGNTPEIKITLLKYLQSEFPDGNAKKVTDINTRSIGNYIIQWYVPMTEDADIMMDFHLVDPLCFETELLFFTGSMKHNVKMRATAKNKGYKLNQYGLWKDEECLTKKELEIFEILAIPYVEPKDR